MGKKKSPNKKEYIFLFIILFTFWFIMSGFTKIPFIIFGFISVTLSIFLAKKLGSYEGKNNQLDIFKLYFRKSAILYIIWLLKEIFVSAIAITKIVWSDKIKIAPNFSWIKTKQTSDINKVFYGNSITMTPGTVCIDIYEDEIYVHSLQKETIEELKKGEMDKRITKI